MLASRSLSPWTEFPADGLEGFFTPVSTGLIVPLCTTSSQWLVGKMHATRALMRANNRTPLTTKMVNKGFYKGTGSGSMGRHTKHGGYIIEWDKVRTYVCPDLSDFKLTPFVTKKMKPLKGRFKAKNGEPTDGLRYIRFWERHGTGQ